MYSARTGSGEVAVELYLVIVLIGVQDLRDSIQANVAGVGMDHSRVFLFDEPIIVLLV